MLCTEVCFRDGHLRAKKTYEVSYGILTAVSAVDSLFECLHLIDIAVSQETPPSTRAFGH